MGSSRSKSSRPTQVKVGFAIYKIEWLSNDEWIANGESDDYGGISKHEEHTILLRCAHARSEDSLRETLLHEILHAVWAVVGLNHYPGNGDEVEERIITQSSPTLLAVLADNPDVLAYLINLHVPD